MANKPEIRIVLDTNWYVSAALNRNSRKQLYQLLIDGRLKILYSKELLDEFESVIYRKKFSKMIRPSQVARLLWLVLPRLEEVVLTTVFKKSRDPKDDYLLSLAVDGRADFLVTGDHDLLILENIGSTQILGMVDFQKAVFEN